MTPTPLDELIIGASAAIRDLRETIRRAAPWSSPVLIQGPTGAGKELVARGLHIESRRRGPFVPFNVAAIPESLFEAELFGHVRGAFSGAVRDRTGLLRRAHGGTAFMDEIGELPLGMQAKLLRVIDTKEVWPVGADSGQKVDFRLVIATNTSLPGLVRTGAFRDDLFFRLRGIIITVPPLREHRQDIAPLAGHFVNAIAAESGGSALTLTSGAVRQLENHVWPGNVRELRRTLEHAAYLAVDGAIGEAHVLEALEPPCDDADLVQPSEEHRRMAALLREHAGDVNAVARTLGVDRSTAYRRIQRLGLARVPVTDESRAERVLERRA